MEILLEIQEATCLHETAVTVSELKGVVMLWGLGLRFRARGAEGYRQELARATASLSATPVSLSPHTRRLCWASLHPGGSSLSFSLPARGDFSVNTSYLGAPRGCHV